MRHTHLLLLFLAGCGADDSFNCDVAARNGTYLATFEAVSGNCGDLPSSVVLFVRGAPVMGPGDDCTALQHASEDRCDVETIGECVGNGIVAKIEGKLSQVDADASHLEGIATLTVSGSGGSCVGTYRLDYRRQ